MDDDTQDMKTIGRINLRRRLASLVRCGAYIVSPQALHWMQQKSPIDIFYMAWLYGISNEFLFYGMEACLYSTYFQQIFNGSKRSPELRRDTEIAIEKSGQQSDYAQALSQTEILRNSLFRGQSSQSRIHGFTVTKRSMFGFYISNFICTVHI